MEISVIIEPCLEGGFTVSVPSIQGCVSQGKTQDEALENIREAIELCLELDEDQIPRDKPGVTVQKIQM